MMDDLAKAYFHRDLTDSERDRLDVIIGSSPNEAFRFLKLSEDYLREIGQPGGGTNAAGPWIGIFFGLLIGSITTWLVLGKPARPIPPTQIPAVVEKAGVIQPKTAYPAPPGGLVNSTVGFTEEKIRLQTHSTTPPSQKTKNRKHEALSVIVEQSITDLTTVRVLDGQGREMRLLFAGLLPPGQKEFIWDGKNSDGLSASPGFYMIEVQSSAGKFQKKVEIGVDR